MSESRSEENRLEGEGDFETRIAWRRNDPVLQDAAREFWARERVLPVGLDPEERIPELMAVSYLGGVVVGVSTVVLRDIPFLRARLGMFRGAVGRDARLQHLARRQIITARNVLLQWSLENPQEKVMGLGAVSTVEFERAPGRTRPITRRSRMQVIGYTDDDQTIRAYWFNHACV